MCAVSESFLQLYRVLDDINVRPEPFEFYTAEDLWTDDHTSAQMLEYHLNPNIDLSSRNHAFIDKSIAWIAKHFCIEKGMHIADFGCGPGLYANRIAELGAAVTGIDFSARSLAYAEKEAENHGLNVNYIHKNYLEFQTEDRFDLIIMIFCDFCALSPGQRHMLLKKFREFLKPEGKILLDVHSTRAFADFHENTSFERNQLNGFWSADEYYGFQVGFKYEEEHVRLDKYTIVEPGRIRTVYNWLQYFDLQSLTREFEAANLRIKEIYSNVAGDKYSADAPEIGVVAARE